MTEEDEEYIRWKKDLLPSFDPIPTVKSASWNEEQKKAAKNLCEWFFDESFNNMFEEGRNEKELENE